MDLIEIAVLLGARKSTRKREIAEQAEKMIYGNVDVFARRVQTLKVIDGLTSAGLLYRRRLGEYHLDPQGDKILETQVPLLTKITSEIQYGARR